MSSTYSTRRYVQYDEVLAENLFSRLKNDPDNKALKDEFILVNLPLAYSIAFRKCPNIHKNDLEDVLSDAVYGMLHGAKKYKIELGFKFSTYVTWWIRHEIDRSPARRRNLTPISKLRRQTNIALSDLEHMFYKKNKREANEDEELASFLGCSPRLIIHARKVLGNAEIISLDAHLRDNTESTLAETVSDSSENPAETALNRIIMAENRQRLQSAIKILSGIEIEMLLLRVSGHGILRIKEEIQQKWGLSYTKQGISHNNIASLKKVCLALNADFEKARAELLNKHRIPKDDLPRLEAHPDPDLAEFVRLVKAKTKEEK